MTQPELAKACQWSSQGRVSNYERGLREPKSGDIALLAKALGVTESYLWTGDDDFVPRPPSEEDYALIEQLTVNGDCGNGYHNDHVEVRGGLVFKRDWIKRMGSKPENLKVIYAKGDSMEPYIVDGDVVLLDLSKTELASGKVYLIRRPDGEISIKRMTQRLTGTWVISSDNPNKVAFPDEEMSVTSAAQIPIIAQVIWRGGAMA